MHNGDSAVLLGSWVLSIWFVDMICVIALIRGLISDCLDVCLISGAGNNNFSLHGLSLRCGAFREFVGKASFGNFVYNLEDSRCGALGHARFGIRAFVSRLPCSPFGSCRNTSTRFHYGFHYSLTLADGALVRFSPALFPTGVLRC